MDEQRAAAQARAKAEEERKKAEFAAKAPISLGEIEARLRICKPQTCV